MRLWFKATAMALVIIALALAGAYIYKQNDVETTYMVHVVKSGETLNGIAMKYYYHNTKNYMTFDQYATMVRVENNKLYNLERPLQAGDRVQVPVYTVRQWTF